MVTRKPDVAGCQSSYDASRFSGVKIIVGREKGKRHKSPSVTSLFIMH